MNRVILVGNLTRDPELRATASGVSVCTFTIAVNKRISREAQAQGARDAEFINIVVWRFVRGHYRLLPMTHAHCGLPINSIPSYSLHFL